MKGSLEMEVLATCRANSVLLAIAFAASLPACDSSTSANSSPAASAIVRPELNADRRVDTTAHLGQQDAVPEVTSTAPEDGKAHDSKARTDAPAGASHVSPPTSQVIGADIARFVSNDAMVRMEKRGDLDGDGDQDVLLVLQKKAQAESAPRALIVLQGAADGSFEKVIENPNAILCQSCGGMMGDPLSDITIQSGGFVLTFEGGSRELWSRTYRFAYSTAEGDWNLKRIDMKVLDRVDGRNEESHATREQIGAISIEDFDAASMAQNQEI
jgi:hypothetical protein